ncbi:MAG: FtsK/SpoIIIE domain-containing protein, partial [Anaerolineales bacterium]
DDSAKRLLSIALNGPRTGVYVILTIDAELPLPYGFNLEDLLTTGSVFESNEGGEFTWKVAELEKLELRLDKPPATEKFNKIISPIPNLLSDDRVEVPFEKICPPDLEWWQGDASSKFRVPLGRRGAREKQFLEFGTNTAHHGLLTGKTGAGKSNLLHVIIINSALIYSPEELVLYLIDFKEGVEFKDYADYKLPHARVVGIESEREFGLSVLREIEQEINRRGVLFKQANAAHDLHEYRSNTGNKLPRIFLIIDEFQRLFSEEDVLASQSSHILAHIIQQGRVFGINVLLASQTLADAYAVGRSTYDQMSVRIALQSTEADSRQILGDNNSAARLLNRPGEAIYNAQNGLEAGNNIFQVAWLPHKKPQDKREHYLEKIKILAEKSHINPPFQQVVFEGDKPSQISKNKELWTTLQTKQKPIVQSAFKVYLGESTEINPPHTEAYIRPQGRSNMMIIGQNERSAFSLISTAWLSLSAYSIAKPLEFYVVDFSRADDTWATMLPRLQKILPNTATVVRQRDFEKMITQVDKILSQRMENNDLAERRIFFILAGLHRARELRATDEYGSFSETAQSLGKICREGPDLGVHVIGWCDTFGNLTRLADRKTIAEFDIRVAMQMSEDDSNQFIESPRAKSLGSNRAYLYDMDKIGRLEKFRPYELITDDELDEIEFFFGKKEKI